MKRNSSENRLAKRKRLFNWIAFLLLFYIVADSSVLEIYCGNENLGIESYSQIIDQNLTSADETEAVSFANISEKSTPNQSTPDSPVEHNGCICSCAHVLISNLYIPRFKEELPLSYRQQHFVSFESLQTESHLQSFFRPPRTA